MNDPIKKRSFYYIILAVLTLAIANLACSDILLEEIEPNYLLIEKVDECIFLNEFHQERGEFEKTSESEIIRRCLSSYTPEQVEFLCYQVDKIDGKCPTELLSTPDATIVATKLFSTATPELDPESNVQNGPPPDCVSGTTDAECNNAGVHRYQLTVEEFGSCVDTGAEEREEEFVVSFPEGLATIESIDFNWVQEFQPEAQNTYVRENDVGSTQRLIFTTDGFAVETWEAQSICFVYTRTLLD